MQPSKPKELWDDLEDTKKHWRQFRAGKLTDRPLGFSVPRDELEESLNAKRYLPEFMDVLRAVRKTQRRKYTIREIASKLSTGANVDNLDYVSDPADGVPYILVKNVLAEGITFSNLKYISKSAAAASMTSVVKSGDIIINRCGDAGIAVIVPDDYAGAIACGFCFILRVKKPHDPYYVTAFLNSSLGRKQLKRLALGSVLVQLAISFDTANRGSMPIWLAWDRSFPRGNGTIFRRLFDDSGAKPGFTDGPAWFC